MSQSDDTPELVCTRAGRSSKISVGVRIGGRIVATFPKVDVVDPGEREKLAGTLCEQFSGLERQNVLEELTAAAALVLEPCAAPKAAQADLLIACAAGAELFCDGDEPYATIPVREHVETHALRTRRLRDWLCGRFYEQHARAPNSEALTAALSVLRTQALGGAEEKVHVRLAPHSHAIVLDLANPEWRVVIIDANGWRIADRSPVKFRRPRGMLAIPAPMTGGSIDELRNLVNLPTDELWALSLAVLVAALQPAGPYPVQTTTGEHGGAKSTKDRYLRALIDPNAAPLRTIPHNVKDFMISACNGWIQLYDNLSGLQPWQSDVLCRLSTGAGHSSRELYTDGEEYIITASRPIMLNGIDAIATRSDLADRSVNLHLPEIPEKQRRPESELNLAFEAARPRILGALLAAASAALRQLPDVKLRTQPRMADFARLGVAAEPALGLQSGAFLRAYGENRAATHEEAVDLSVIGQPLQTLLVGRPEWTGTAGELLTALNGVADDTTRKLEEWPRKARGMSSALRRLAPNLRALGWSVELPTKGTGRDKRRVITLRRPDAAHCPDGADHCGANDPRQWSASHATPCAGVQNDSVSADHAVHAVHSARTLSDSGVEVFDV